MKETTLDIIKRNVAVAKTIPNAMIEYNFKELPKGVTATNFFGVQARMNEKTPNESACVIYKM